MSKYNFDAVIFDLDGVITKTALVHSAAWKQMFDEFLLKWSEKQKLEFKEFSHENDYLPFVDGKPRYKGVASFLESRNIDIPYGKVEDDPGLETVCGLGNRKNQAFNEVLDHEGVEVYESTVALMRELKEKGFRVGVASSSKNCEAVLEKAGLLDLVETRVDGVVSAEIGLQGKPEPDIFTTAADNLGVVYDRSVVVEDAVSGVQAGKKGNFGLVLGIARENNAHELKINGADIVVSDIDEIGFDGIISWFEEGLVVDNWSISYDDFVPEKEKTRETLLTIGNGYFGTRGALPESGANEFNYPGTYIAGLYNRLTSKVGDRDVENEDFVNAPNWISVTFKVDNSDWIEVNKTTLVSIRRRLNLRDGMLQSKMHIRMDDGKELEIESDRFASMDDHHAGALHYRIKPLNFSGVIKVRSGIDANIINDGVARYRQLNQKHLTTSKTFSSGEDLLVCVKTVQSDIQISTASKVSFSFNHSPVKIGIENESQESSAYVSCTFDAEEGAIIELVNRTCIYTSQFWDTDDPEKKAMHAINVMPDFAILLENSAEAWTKIWKKIDVQIEGDRLAQKLIRLHLYHLMVSFSPHNTNVDASITARGLHGEAYRGHIFWDELFILPLYNLHFPKVTRAALKYRYRRLGEARKYADSFGFKGAMYPWQSGSDGREETQVVHLNPLTGKWGEDFSSFQRHVSLAIAYNIWQFQHVSNDTDYMAKEGAEMFFDICRFWASKAIWDNATDRYTIKNVMGPDEFHEKYPGSNEGGLADNAYTNIMVVWIFQKAMELIDQMGKKELESVFVKLNFQENELDQWKHIASKLNIVIKEDVIAQYDGYFKLKELDWEYYRKKYTNIYRMDRLLKAEGKSADDFKVAKQADTLQTFYNLDEETVSGILKSLGYNLSENFLARNLEYYLARTSHGSTLSRVVHAQLANMIDDGKLSWTLYLDALTSDYADIQGGTTGEGIHAGVMAGTVLIALQSYAGIDLRSERVKINPKLPQHWRKMNFGFSFQGNRYLVEVSKGKVCVLVEIKKGEHVEVEIKGEICRLNHKEKFTREY